MAKRNARASVERSQTPAPKPRSPRRAGVGAVDVMVISAMAAASVAAGVALHLQAELRTVTSAVMAAALFALLAFIHVQRLRIEHLRSTETPANRQEPTLESAQSNDSTLEIASSKLASAAAALREGEPGAQRREPALAEATREEAEEVAETSDHGWGEPGAVDALVRQYAQELDRGETPAVRPTFGKAPKPGLRGTVRDREPVLELPPVAESPLAAVIRRAAEGEIEIHLQPVVAFADRKARMYEVFPRIIDLDGRVLGQDDYGPDAAAMGLTLSIERAALLRCCAIQRKLSERGRARAMFFRLSSAAIRDRSFLQRLLADIKPDPLLADLIIFEIDQQEIEQGDGAERDNMEFLGNAGFRFSLGSAETLALEVEELSVRRIGFVRVTPAVLNAEQNPAAVSDLRNGGIETIVTSIVREEDVRVGRAFGLVLGQGSLFSEPKPLRADVAGAPAAPQQLAAPKRTGRTRAA